jgi:Ca2+-binding RTX toxin-like protein
MEYLSADVARLRHVLQSPNYKKSKEITMSLFRRAFGRKRPNGWQKKLKRIALLESLEVREVPAIALVGTELRVTGSHLNDAVAIAYGPRGSGQIVASRTQISSEGQSVESQAFPLSSVTTIRVVLGNGDNQFINNTNVSSRVFGGTGFDVMTGGGADDELLGAGGNDLLKGGGGNDLIEGSGGNDVLEGGDGNDIINGGDGIDTIRGDAGNDSIQGGNGNDLLQGGEGLDQIRGNEGNDRLLGGNDNDSLYGDAGNDILEGELGDDWMFGGVGSDKLVGSSGNDRLYGEADTDQLFGGLGNDRAYGGDGPDSIFGNDGNDDLRGDAGDDTIEGGIGADVIYGGDGNDKLYGAFASSTTNSVDSGNSIRGGNGDDLIESSGGNDWLYGEAGKDRIKAGGGNDRIYGGLDDDSINAGDGNDEAYGDSGNDLVQGGKGEDRVEGGSGDDIVAANVAFLSALPDDPTVSVDDVDTAGNTLVGGQGNDRIFGSNMNDVLSGNDGNDWLSGLAGNDELYGGNGQDVLLGGSGIDKLDGGLNVDRLVDIDGGFDTIIPQPINAITVERDELWIDNIDRLGNLLAVSKVQSQFSDSVHVVGQYRSYDAFGFLQFTPPMAWGVSDLIDPDIRDQHQDNDFLSKMNFGNSPLYGPDGPVWDDIDQGAVGTCYFLSRLAALAKTHPQHIRDMVTELGDGTFVVQFLNQDGNRVFVRVDGDLYHDGGILYANRGTGKSMWVAVVEKAWAIHRYGYATYDSINGGNGVQNDDRIDTALALGINDIKIDQDFAPTPQLFANMLKALLDAGNGVVFGGRSFIDDNMPLVSENYRRSEHILMVHSLDTNAQGNVTKIRYYDLYGGPLKEMTNLDVFFFGCGGLTAFKPLA